MNKRGWMLRLRTFVIVVLSLLAVATGALWGMSYPPLLQRSSIQSLHKLLYFESRGLMVRIFWGNISVHYSYPVEEPIDPNPSFPGTLRTWLQYFDATETCDPCGARFRRGESCPKTNSLLHSAHVTYGLPPIPKLNWYQRIVNWNSRVFTTVRSNSLTVRFWLPFTLFAAYPCFFGLRVAMRRWRKRGRDQCKGCGYLLIGNTSGICPECGKPVPEELRSRLAE